MANKNRAVTVGVGIASVLALGVVDRILGYELSFFVFYFIPIAFVASRTNVHLSYVFSVFCAATWFVADRISGHPYEAPFSPYWNALVRLAAFAVVGHMVSRLAARLNVARTEVRELRSFLPICSKCKKIRDAEGAWHQIEAYMTRHAEIQFSHGLCQHCADEIRKDSERVAGMSASPASLDPALPPRNS